MKRFIRRLVAALLVAGTVVFPLSTQPVRHSSATPPQEEHQQKESGAAHANTKHGLPIPQAIAACFLTLIVLLVVCGPNRRR